MIIIYLEALTTEAKEDWLHVASRNNGDPGCGWLRL